MLSRGQGRGKRGRTSVRSPPIDVTPRAARDKPLRAVFAPRIVLGSELLSRPVLSEGPRDWVSELLRERRRMMKEAWRDGVSEGALPESSVSTPSVEIRRRASACEWKRPCNGRVAVMQR